MKEMDLKFNRNVKFQFQFEVLNSTAYCFTICFATAGINCDNVKENVFLNYCSTRWVYYKLIRLLCFSCCLVKPDNKTQCARQVCIYLVNIKFIFDILV